MRLRAPSVVLGVVLLTATVQRADTGAPLESTKQQLRKLNDGQKPGTGPGATEGLRPSLPTIQTPGQEALPSLQLTDPEKLEKERKRQKNERKNWLVNGVEQLEQKDKGKKADVISGGETKADGNDSRSVDEADPQYLLKLYDEQKKVSEAHKIETKPQRTPQADPFAPFLQGWLGNSPVRGQFFDEFARKPEGTTTGPTSLAPVAMNGSRDFTSGPQTATNPVNDLPAKPNPYLAELNRPVQSEPSGNALSGQNPLNSLDTASPFSKPLIPLAQPPVETRPPERKPLPAPLADDKKYFPQLKKF